MSSINMIAARRAERKRSERQVRIAAMVVLCELVALFAILSFMTARIYAASGTIRQLDKKLVKILPTVEKIKGYEAETKKLQPKVDLLADSCERTLVWYSLMQNLGRSVSENTWLSSINSVRSVPAKRTDSSEPETPKTTVNLRGTSVNQRLVGETMLRLNQYPGLERVDLNYTQNGRSQALNTIDFEIATLLASYDDTGGGARPHGGN